MPDTDQFSPAPDPIALRAAIARGLKAVDPVAALQTPPATGDRTDLLHEAADAGGLTERQLHLYLTHLFKKQAYEQIYRLTEDKTLGFATLRRFHALRVRFHQADPHLTLADIKALRRDADPISMTRQPLVALAFGQSCREQDWSFVISWVETAMDREIAAISPRFMLGALIGLIDSGHAEVAREMRIRMEPFLKPLERLRYAVPDARLAGRSAPCGTDLLRSLRDTLATDEPEWDWLCATYEEKRAQAARDFMDVRTDPQAADALRQRIIEALRDRRPLAFQRLGDGESYRWSLPDIARHAEGMRPAHDGVRETSWWGRTLDRSFGDMIAARALEAFRDADIVGIMSPHRLLNDAMPGPLSASQSGCALLAHVHALGRLIPLDDKIVTEERAHTILFDDATLAALFEVAAHVVFVGGTSPARMRLPPGPGITHLPLVPEANKNLHREPDARHLLEAFDEIAHDVARLSGPGVLVLFSGGYMGKPLGAVAREAGAVALDIGSFADTLAGRATRSPAAAVLRDMIPPAG